MQQISRQVGGSVAPRRAPAPQTSAEMFPNIRRGKMTPAEKEQVATLTARRICTFRIAQQLNRHPSTVHNNQIRAGIKEPITRTFRFMRGGKMVQSFSGQEDAFISALRAQGLSSTLIQKQHADAFPDHPRRVATISTRLIMLATMEEAEQ